MEFEKINNKGQATIFKNRYLETLTKAHPLLIWSIYSPVLILFPYLAIVKYNIDIYTTFMVFIAGVFWWTLTEYCLHRFAFHYHPKSKLGKRIIYIIHGNHHQFPRDKERLFMPPIPSVILASIFFGLYFLLLGHYALAFFPGFMFGYLLYGSIHYAIHAFPPPFPWLKPLWKNHHLHHYKADHKGYGVSNTIWDRIFGTMYDCKKEVVDPEKVKALMFDK
jgi:sterol desaturase/sphingolipid hydroxylase (fatty acid hydroxylase superfamily)